MRVASERRGAVGVQWGEPAASNRRGTPGLQGLPSTRTLPSSEHDMDQHSGQRSAFFLRHRRPRSLSMLWQSTLSSVICSTRVISHARPHQHTHACRVRACRCAHCIVRCGHRNCSHACGCWGAREATQEDAAGATTAAEACRTVTAPVRMLVGLTQQQDHDLRGLPGRPPGHAWPQSPGGAVEIVLSPAALTCLQPIAYPGVPREADQMDCRGSGRVTEVEQGRRWCGAPAAPGRLRPRARY